jgi:hypothetical protein
VGDAQAVTDRLALDQRGGYGSAGAERGEASAIGIAHRKAAATLGAVTVVATRGPVSRTTRPSVRRSTSTEPSWSVR